jgi:hypothetical protein
MYSAGVNLVGLGINSFGSLQVDPSFFLRGDDEEEPDACKRIQNDSI